MAQDRFLGDPMYDRMMLIIMNLAEELYVTKDRLAVVESLLHVRGVVNREDIELYRPSEAAEAEMTRTRHRFIARLLDQAISES